MVVPFWMFLAPCSSLTLTMFGERDKALLRGVLVGGVWNGFLLGKVRIVMSLVGFVVVMIMMVIFFGICSFPPLVEVRENPEFHEFMEMG